VRKISPGKAQTSRSARRPKPKAEIVSEVRHRTILYNSLYRADNDLLVNQHAYGISAANGPVFHLRNREGSDMFGSYVESFGRIWSSSK
jgi:hypothetical protein